MINIKISPEELAQLLLGKTVIRDVTEVTPTKVYLSLENQLKPLKVHSAKKTTAVLN